MQLGMHMHAPCTITLPMPMNLFFARLNTSLSLENNLSTAHLLP